MNAKDAADAIRPSFHLESMPPDARHHMAFVEKVAAELGVEATGFNLAQIAAVLDHAGIDGDPIVFPMMLYSRQHHAVEGVEPSMYLARHDAVAVHVADEDQVKALGAGWFESLADLPARGDIKLHADVKAVEPPAIPVI